MYMEKCFIDLAGGNVTIDGVDYTPTDNVTFTPPFGAHTWQLRIMSNNDVGMSIEVETIDEDTDNIHIDGSPFVNTGGGGTATSDFGAGGDLEITLDSTNPSVKVTIKDSSGTGATATVKCKAYRTLEDIATGGYTIITPLA
tara:strand:- start:209 stop:634 length:426 start_codon:yes stop_codon:yes gene_type:complete